MTNLTCEDFGLTKEQMLDRLIERMTERMLGLDEEMEDQDQSSYYNKSTVMAKIDSIIKERVDSQVNAIANEHVIPRVHELIESLVFQETNQFGESKKPPMTLREYLDNKAKIYMSEIVNYKGKTKAEDSYSWKGEGSRLMHAVNDHLYDQLNALIKDSAGRVHGQFADSVKSAVDRAVRSLSVTVKTTVK